ncbi:MAG: type II toxin-antitoxin system YafQ family toxin [Candidatus Scalindua sp.]
MVKKVKEYQFSNRFKKDYKMLSKEIQKSFNEKLSLFLNDTHHPSLRVKKIQGAKDRWEGSVSKNYRFTFCFSGKTVIFRRIGTHDILNKS